MARKHLGLSSRVRFLSSFRWVWTTDMYFLYSHNTFASAGGDGTVSIWDHTAKKRLRQYPKYPMSVQDIAFNVDGSRLAIGVSYGWENGAEQAGKSVGTTRVYVREVGDEVKVCTKNIHIVSFLPMPGIFFFPIPELDELSTDGFNSKNQNHEPARMYILPLASHIRLDRPHLVLSFLSQLLPIPWMDHSLL